MKFLGRTNERVIERLLDSPLGRQAAADEERERLSRRCQLLAEVDETRARLTPQLQELKAKEREAELHLDAARRLVAAREAELAEIAGQAIAKSSALDHQVSRREHELRQTAHPALAEFIADAHARANAVRNHVETALPRHVTDILGRTQDIPGESNAAAVGRLRPVLLAAIAEAEALRLGATPDVQIEAWIATRRQALRLPVAPDPVSGQPVAWRDESAIQFPEIEGPLRQPGPLLTPAEQRDAAWAAGEATR